jgi:hypothetical protein
MWRFSQPPPDLNGIVFTTGYSIENDLYAGSDIEALLDNTERIRHSQLISTVCRWFAFEVLEFQAGRNYQVSHHIRHVIDFVTMDLSAAFCSQRGYSEPNPAFVGLLVSDYKLRLRGKTLMQVLIAHLSDSNRTPKYSNAAIIEMCLKLYPDNPYIKRLIAAAHQGLT